VQPVLAANSLERFVDQMAHSDSLLILLLTLLGDKEKN
jgi:hypothetical protein